ncbi:hypothetical protein R1sor_027184 [Riccia sorocarpa]|uniref:Uncharacterized protein n=1 Tax=Riccia sorocarpa TaxID=122646 RepID=A0ABD3GF65_9MARC
MVARRVLIKDHRRTYEAEITSRLCDTCPNSNELTQVISQVADRTVRGHRSADKPWFDNSCWRARCYALQQPLSSQKIAFRHYKNLIRAKKRLFLREKQQSLTRELIRDPQLFWQRLKPAHLTIEVDDRALLGYVRGLHFFPLAEDMPSASGPGCNFDEEEVERGVRRMSSGKAADIEGLTIELFKWGGSAILPHLTHLLSEACSIGLPVEWVRHRGQPLEEGREYKYLGLAVTSNLSWGKMGIDFRNMHLMSPEGEVGLQPFVDGLKPGVYPKLIGETPSHYRI